MQFSFLSFNMVLRAVLINLQNQKRLTKRPKNGLRSFVKDNDFHHAEVHLTGGILRHFRALSTLKQNPALEVLSTPAHPQVTHTVNRFTQSFIGRI